MPSRRYVVLVLGLMVVACAASAAGAGASTIAGQVSGATLPKASVGQSTVWAVRATDLVIVDVAKVSAQRYRLDVPAGNYWIFGATTRFRGKEGVDRELGKVTVRRGQRKKLKVSLRKPKQAKRPTIPRIPGLPTRPVARAAFVNVKHPAVWVQHFAVSGPADYNVLRKGLADMLITDLLPVIASTCDGVIVEREHLDWIIAEQLLSQSRSADPSTRIPTDRLVAHNREVTGRLTVAGATATLTVTVKNVVTGTTRSVTRSSASGARVLELERAVVQETARLICGDKPPGHYAGQASGSVGFVDGASSQSLSWNGDVRLKFTGDVVAAGVDEPAGEYALYAPESGSMHYRLDGTEGECSYHGTADATIVPSLGEGARVQQGVDEPTYSLLASLPAGATMTVTTTGPSHCGGGTTSPFPLAGRVYLGMTTGASQRSSSSALAGFATLDIGLIKTRWDWSLAPQAA